MLVASLVALLTGCADAPPSSGDVSIRPSLSPTAQADTAADYPYRLPWPEDELETPWRLALVPWDGSARIDHGDKYTDSVRTSVGDLFAFGYPTTGSAADVRGVIARQATEWHGCDDQPTHEWLLAGGGVEGIEGLWYCGTIRVLRWAGVHEGFGMAIMLIVTTSDLEDARAAFERSIGDLIWTN
jgi:hypothetical protein